MTCKCAKRTDEYNGWECEISGGACMFLIPDSKACAEIYGEGPDVEQKIEYDCNDCQYYERVDGDMVCVATMEQFETDDTPCNRGGIK